MKANFLSFQFPNGTNNEIMSVIIVIESLSESLVDFNSSRLKIKSMKKNKKNREIEEEKSGEELTKLSAKSTPVDCLARAFFLSRSYDSQW